MKKELFYIFVIIIISLFFIVSFITNNGIEQFKVLSASAAPLPETEFTTHRKIDNELGIVCYTTVMLKNSEISELTMSCVPLPATCNYGEKKVSYGQYENW